MHDPRPMDLELERMTAEHAPFLRRLAHALVGDHDGAEDLVQETWLAAAEQPRGNVRSPRAWLAGTARKLAVSARRRGARKRLTRLASEPAGEASEPLEIISALEAERALIAALESLPGPQRTAVWLRYREGMGVTEIAERVGAPPNTVRGRLRRGLARLREGLEESHGDVPAAVGPLVMRPGADPEASVMPALETAHLGEWCGAHVGVGPIAAIAIAAASALLISVQGREPQPGDDPVGRTRRSGTPAEASSILSLPSTSTRSRVSAAGRPSTSGAAASEIQHLADHASNPAAGGAAPHSLLVRAVTDAGVPVAGMSVWSEEGVSNRPGTAPGDAARTDGDGVVRIVDIGHELVTVFVTGESASGRHLFGHGILCEQDHLLASGTTFERSDGEDSEVVIEVRRTPSVAGRIVDEWGRPSTGMVRAAFLVEGQARGFCLEPTDEDGGFVVTSNSLAYRIDPEDVLCAIGVYQNGPFSVPVASAESIPLGTEDLVLVVTSATADTGTVVGELRAAEGGDLPEDGTLHLSSFEGPFPSRTKVALPRRPDGSIAPGPFVVRGVEPGQYALWFSGDSGESIGSVAGIDVRGGATVDAGTVLVGAGASLALVPDRASLDRMATDGGVRGGGPPLVALESDAGSRVTLEWDDGAWRSRYENLAPGRWRLASVPAPHLTLDCPPIDLAHGDDARAPVTLRRVREFVVDLQSPSGATWTTARVKATDLTPNRYWARSFPDRTAAHIERESYAIRLPCHSRCELRVVTDTGLEATIEVEVGGLDRSAERVQLELTPGSED